MPIEIDRDQTAVAARAEVKLLDVSIMFEEPTARIEYHGDTLRRMPSFFRA